MSNEAYPLLDVTDTTSEYNGLMRAMQNTMDARMNCHIVKVQKVTTTGQVAAIGRVDVQPLVQMIDGIGRTTDHETVFNLPYVRFVGGAKGIILDPKVGDIGLVMIADRDISGVKKSKKLSPPGTRRKNNIADGMYLGSVLADAPTSYVQFEDDGTITVSPDNGTTKVRIKKDLIIASTSGGAELVCAPTHVQMKQKGSSTLHATVDIGGNQLICGMDWVTGPDPYPGD